MEDITFINRKLIDWYEVNKRDLPWRNTHDPYKIWISEIILQQTRVAQGFDYYIRFIERFPTVQSLATAEEQEVLKYWQGLGYYSRARNLHAAAKMIQDHFSGIFPSDYNTLLTLKGIGEYTAAAIASFAWNLPHPVVDGNVFRFLSRLFAIDEPIDTQKGKKYFTQLADSLMDKHRAGLFNQAIMEFGALHCTPSTPACMSCPFQTQCMAYTLGRVLSYPIKQNKTKTQERYLYYFHIHYNNHIYINRRKGKGIWQNLFEFPLIESEVTLSFEELSQSIQFQELFPADSIPQFRLVIENRKHILSHRILQATFYEVYIENEPIALSEYHKIEPAEINDFPIHRLMELYLEEKEKKN